MPLTGGHLDAANTEAILGFPAFIEKAFTQWRVGAATIDDRDVTLVQGTTAAKTPIKLYFDEKSGLLVRALYYTDTAVGRVPTQIDYEDYREISGIKIPYKWTSTWTDGQAHFNLNDLQVNGPIDPAKFARPVPAPTH
jgi:hypothetical protein